MGTALTVVAFIACLAVVGILAFGIGGFGTGKMSPKRQNKLMQYRIMGQAVAVVLILLAVMALRAE
ncbi:MAG: twin transmembrane helix small protein [Pseudomonadota bacterium]